MATHQDFVYFDQGIFLTLWIKWYEVFCKNGQRLNTVNYFWKKVHLRCFTWFWIRFRIWSLNTSLNTSLFLLSLLHFESLKFRSSCSKISFKIDVFKNFAIFTRKHLCWSLFMIKLRACKPANLLRRHSNTGVFLRILQNF